jgi:hypothetical protein
MTEVEHIDYEELTCPYCGKQVSREEYKHAMEEFKLKAAQEYIDESEKQRKYYEERIEEQKKIVQEKTSELTKSHKEELKVVKQELQMSYHEQLGQTKKTYDEINAQRQKEFRELIEKESSRYEEELYEKDRQYQEIKDNLEQYKVQAVNEARSLVENEMLEKNTQIHRLGERVDSLSKELSKTQSELSGEVGELNLLKKLEKAFPEDTFRRQTRGNSSGDIIHYIKSDTGALLDPIVYDNKESASVTKHDIEKAKRYRETHGTDYVIIVSKNLPKDISEAFGGEKEGILIVHPGTVVLVAKEIRKGLIGIAKESSSKKYQLTKQAKLYDYIRGKDFARNLVSISQNENRLSDLQDKEIRSHKTLWKNREEIFGNLTEAYTNISSMVDAIIQQDQEEQIDIQHDADQRLKNNVMVDGNGDGNGRGDISS